MGQQATTLNFLQKAENSLLFRRWGLGDFVSTLSADLSLSLPYRPLHIYKNHTGIQRKQVPLDNRMAIAERSGEATKEFQIKIKQLTGRTPVNRSRPSHTKAITLISNPTEPISPKSTQQPMFIAQNPSLTARPTLG